MGNYKFGKLAPVIDERTLRLENYLQPVVPPPPLLYNVLDEINTTIKDPAVLLPMLGNDQVGDCVAAGAYHSNTLYKGLVSQQYIPTTQEVLDFYYRLTGGADTGLNMLSVEKYWQQKGIGGEKILAFVSVDSTNHVHLMQAIHLFGCVPIGIAVQDNFIDQFNAKVPWDGSGNDTGDGHDVVLLGFDQTKKVWYLSTWGAIQEMTFDCGDKVIDEAYCNLPLEATNIQFAGVDFATLKSDLALVQN
jgi:hypothetical protein